MYEITVVMTPKTETAESHIASRGKDHVRAHFDEVINWWNGCIEENLILNLCVMSVDEWPDISIYYSISAEAAQTFADRFQNLEADFSMRKLWNLVHFDTEISINTCDFEDTWADPILSENNTLLWSGIKRTVGTQT
jgi:hypothetical protein